MLPLFLTNNNNSASKSQWQLWQHENHPLLILSEVMFYDKVEYIHNNPVKSGIVEIPESYLYSSAQDFEGEKGLIDLKNFE